MHEKSTPAKSGGESEHIRGLPNQHPSIDDQITNAIFHQSINQPETNHDVLLILRRPINRPRRPDRRLHPSNRRLLHQPPRHDPRDIRIRRWSRTVSPKNFPEMQFRQKTKSSVVTNTVSLFAKRHALKFGSQKINLHLSGHEFEPKASRVQPGSEDLCFITQHPIDGVLSLWKGVGIEVSVIRSAFPTFSRFTHHRS